MPFPEDLLQPALGWAVLAALVAGLMRGFTGFGSAMFMAPIFALLFGPREMVGTIILMEQVIGLQLAPQAMRPADWRFLAPVLLAALAGIPVGAWLLVSVEPADLIDGVSIMVLAFVAILSFGWRYTGRKRDSVSLLAGLLSGALMSATSAGGPPVLLYMLSGPDSAAANRANIIVYLFLSGFAVLALLFGAGVLGWPTVWRAAVLLPAMMLTTHLGARAFRASSERFYRRVALAFLLGAGVLGLVR